MEFQTPCNGIKKHQVRLRLHFQINFPTQFGQMIYLIGNLKELKNWTPKGVQMKWTKVRFVSF